MKATFVEREFCDLTTLAFLYDTTREHIRETVKKLQEAGYGIETMRWGGNGTVKVNQKQFKVALLAEYSVKL